MPYLFVFMSAALVLAAGPMFGVINTRNLRPSRKSEKQLMNDQQFEAKVYEWQRKIEDVLIEIDTCKTREGLIIACDISPAVDEFTKLLVELRRVRAEGVLRAGMKVQ